MDMQEFYTKTIGVKDKGLAKALAQTSELRSYATGTKLIGAGQKQTHMIFLVKGVVGGTTPGVNGQPVTSCLAYRPGSLLLASIDWRQPSDMDLSVLLQCELVYISYEDAKAIAEQYPEFLQIYIHHLGIITQYYYQLKNAICQLDAAKRYEWFLENFPGLIGMVTNKCVASLLDMTPVTLSRVRRCMRENNQAFY